MADMGTAKNNSLVEDYLLKGTEAAPENPVKPAEETPVSPVEEAPVSPVEEAPVSPGEEAPVSPADEEVVPEKIDETPIVEKSEVPDGTVEASTEASDASSEESTENAPDAEPANEEGNGSSEEAAEIKLETAPADFRFPTTNQTRHCFTRYIEYHRCIAAKGDDAPECQKFAKYYRSLCPGEWIDRWNEQRENGTFPGPL